MLRVAEITSRSQLDQLGQAWTDLLGTSVAASPFLTPEWFRCCLDAYGDGKEPCVLTVHDGARLLGVAPLWRYRGTIRRIPTREVGFIACPDTPFVDFIVHREHVEPVLTAMLEHLWTDSSRAWDVLTLAHWPTDARTCRAVPEILREHGRAFVTRAPEVGPYVALEGAWPAFLQGRSSRFRKSQRNVANRIQKLAGLHVECLRSDAAGDVFKNLLAISERSWKQREGVAMASREEAKQFFADLVDVASQRGWLLVWLLMAGEIPIAMEYDVVDGERVYALRADFDEAYRAYSPGTYLQYQVLRQLLEDGYAEYSFGPGIDPYKLQWTERRHENALVHVWGHTATGRLLASAERWIVPIVRRLRAGGGAGRR